MKKEYSSVLTASMICPFVGSAALLSVGILDLIKNGAVEKAVSLTIACVFWVSVVTQFVLLLAAIKMQKKNNKHKKTKGIGLLRFFSNRKAAAADIVLICSVIVVAVLIVSNIQNSWLILISVSVLYCSLNMHCYLNGKNYRSIKQNSYKKGER